MIALIDGDVLCYHACKSRWVKTKQTVENTDIVHLDSTTGKRLAVEYTQEEDQEYMMQSWSEFGKQLAEILENTFATTYLMAVKSSTNFRDDMYQDYKKQRKDHASPNVFVPVLRQLAIKDGLAIPAIGREADDLLRIWAEQAIAAGDPYVICSVDKDLKCIPGPYYDMKKRAITHTDALEAARHYHEQLLKGDPTDNIPGVIGIGNIKAANLLKDSTTIEEFQEVVVDAYIRAYGDGWYDMLLSNGKMIHLQRHSEDYFSFKEWPVVRELL